MNILKRHGFKLSLGVLLGYLVMMVTVWVGVLILGLVFGGSLYAIFGNSAPFTSISPEHSLSLVSGGTIIVVFLAILLYLLLIIGCSAYQVSGLTGSVNDAVFRDQSSIGSFTKHGFKNLWRSLKLSLLLFVCSIPIAILMIIPLIIPLVNFLVIIFFYLPATTAVIHCFIISHEKNLGAWDSIKAGFLTFRKAYGKTLISSLLSLVAALGFILIFALLGGLFIGFNVSSQNLSGAAIFIIMLLSLLFFPAMSVINQLVITIRLKDKIAPVVFGGIQTVPPTPPVQQQDPNQFRWE